MTSRVTPPGEAGTGHAFEYLLEADRDRTIVHHIAEGELFGWMRLMKPIAALMAKSERARTIRSLKRSLESA